MDSVTQAILGAAIGEAGWRRRLGGRAVVVGAVAGTLPDLDVVAAAAGQWSMLVHHRGFTHSIFFAPLMCVPLGWLAKKWGKKGALGHWVHLVFWALLTHPLLDACTTYGTQLLYPASDHRTAVDAIAIIDPVYTGPLAIALLIAWLARAKPMVGAVCASLTLVLTTGYLGFGYAQSERAEALLLAALEPEFEPVEVRAMPAMGTVFAWRVVARDDDRNLRIAQVSTLRPFVPPVVKLAWPDHPLVEAALEHEHGQIARWFAMDMIGARVLREPGHTVIRLDDQRYGRYTDPTVPLWGARFVFDAEGVLVHSEWVEERYEIRLSDELNAVRSLIRGTPLPLPTDGPP